MLTKATLSINKMSEKRGNGRKGESAPLMVPGIDKALYESLSPEGKIELAKFHLMTPEERIAEMKFLLMTPEERKFHLMTPEERIAQRKMERDLQV